jgi:hypothetical protein
MTKQDALNKIAELQKFIEDLDTPKFELGDVFRTASGEVSIISTGYLTVSMKEKRYQFGGVEGNILKPHSDGHRSGGLNTQEISDIIKKRGWKKIGKLGIIPLTD